MGLCPVTFPGVKLIHRNVSSLELEHSTSQGEYSCKNAAKEISPSREGARTTYVCEKISLEQCKWCPDLVLALHRAWISPCMPIPSKDTKHVAIKGPAQEHNCSHQISTLYFPFPGWDYSDYIMAAEESEEGKKSTRATTCCKSSKDALISHTVPFPFSGGVSCWLPCFLSLPLSYQDYYDCLIIPFYAVDKNINHFYQMF